MISYSVRGRRGPDAALSANSSNMPRFLGIDYGARRIGLAVGDSVLWLASPVTMIPGGDGVDRCVERVIPFVTEYAADELVVGLPLNMVIARVFCTSAASRGLLMKRARNAGSFSDLSSMR